MEITPEIAEFLGMHAGDGTFYRTNSGLVWELRGGLEEEDFYDNYVAALLKSISGKSIIPKLRAGGKNGCYGVRCCSGRLIEILQATGHVPGAKVKIVHIPKSIVHGFSSVKAAFLRGLFATDGSAHLMRVNQSKVSTYPRISLATISSQLALEASALLSDLGIRHSLSATRAKTETTVYQIQIAGTIVCRAFVERVGLSNPKHLLRIRDQIFKNEPVPRSSQAQVA